MNHYHGSWYIMLAYIEWKLSTVLAYLKSYHGSQHKVYTNVREYSRHICKILQKFFTKYRILMLYLVLRNCPPDTIWEKYCNISNMAFCKGVVNLLTNLLLLELSDCITPMLYLSKNLPSLTLCYWCFVIVVARDAKWQRVWTDTQKIHPIAVFLTSWFLFLFIIIIFVMLGSWVKKCSSLQ